MTAPSPPRCARSGCGHSIRAHNMHGSTKCRRTMMNIDGPLCKCMAYVPPAEQEARQ